MAKCKTCKWAQFQLTAPGKPQPRRPGRCMFVLPIIKCAAHPVTVQNWSIWITDDNPCEAHEPNDPPTR